MNDFEEFIINYFQNIKDSEVKEAMLYALLGGKRFRPSLTFAILKGFNLNPELAYHSALALEMIHTYSLIHDDLPCMDDDDYRRGKLAVHKAFKENIAVLAGDGLLTESFRVIIKDRNLNDSKKVKIINHISSMAGEEGMIYGQFLDLKNENNPNITKEIINEIDDYKTGCLFKCALLIAMVICDDEDNIDFYETLGLKIGRIFQVQDDLFDIIKTQEETGKPTNSDLKNNKVTALSINTIDEIKHELEAEFNSVYELLDKQKFNTEYLKDIIIKIEKR